MKLVEMRISDKRVLKLIHKWLKTGVMEEGNIKRADLRYLVLMSRCC